MSLSFGIEPDCARCGGTGRATVVRQHVACSCPTGRLMAFAPLPLLAIQSKIDGTPAPTRRSSMRR